LAEQRFLHGFGSSKYGSRYIEVNGPRAVYFGEDKEVALHECIVTTGQADPRRFPPHIIFSVNVALASILDLGEVSVQVRLGTSMTELVEPWRLKQARKEVVPTQILGKVIFESGRYEAIRYPSAQLPGHSCMVVFYERVVAPSLIEIVDPEGHIYERIPIAPPA
jgi:RES domain-containing protein